MSFFSWSDPFLLTAKICKCLSEKQTDAYQFVANRAFELFAVSFFLTRNVFYNYIVVSVVLYARPWALNIYIERPLGVVLMYLLVVLAGLQTYWAYLIIRALERKRRVGHIEDMQDEDNEKKKKV